MLLDMGMMQFISILLGCLMTEVYNSAALPTAYATVPPEAWHQYYYWWPQYYQGWAQAGETPAENPTHVKALGQNKQVDPWRPSNAEMTGTKKDPEKPRPQANVPQAKPRGFQLSLNVPISNTEDKNKEHSKTYIVNRDEGDHSQSYYRPSQFQAGSNFESASRVSSHQPSANFQNNDPRAASASKQGFHFSLSVPVASTTAPPRPFDRGNRFENAGLSNTGFSETRFFHHPQGVHEVRKPVYQKPSDTKPVIPKPAESKLVTFLTGLLEKPGSPSDQNDRVNVHREPMHGFVKPVVPQQPSRPSGFHPGHYSPSNYWMGQAHLSSSTNAGSGVQNPVHQAVQHAVHYSPQWYQVAPPANLENRDGYDDILQSVQDINGQLMIPLEKCPGFERFAAHIHHRQVHHGHHGHHSQPAKPQYTKFVLDMKGTAPNINEASYETNVQQSGAGRYPNTWWQHTGAADPQSAGSHNTRQFVNPVSYMSHVQREPGFQYSNVDPGHTNYVVQLGANVGYEKPNTQSGGNVQYLIPQRPHRH